MSYRHRMQGQACGVGHCKETGLTSWCRWQSLNKEAWKPGGLKYVKWMRVLTTLSGNWESHPAANLMLSVPSAIEIEKRMKKIRNRIIDHHRIRWCLDCRWLVLGSYIKNISFICNVWSTTLPPSLSILNMAIWGSTSDSIPGQNTNNICIVLATHIRVEFGPHEVVSTSM